MSAPPTGSRAARDALAVWARERAAEGDVIVTRGGHDEDGAVFDASGEYRYALWRTWRVTGPRLLVVTLNPNKADEKTLDQTSRLCREWAQRLGFGSVWIGSIFAYCSPDFRGVKRQENPVGSGNDWWLARMHEASDTTLVAWGDYGRHLDRGRVVMEKLVPIRPVVALGRTDAGQPHHLLGLRADAGIVPFPAIPPELVWCRKCPGYIGTANGIVKAILLRKQHDEARHPAPYRMGFRPRPSGRLDRGGQGRANP